jgi:hypothetical protein
MSENEISAPKPNYSYSKDPASLTKFLKVMLWISLTLCMLQLIFDYMQLSLLKSSFTPAEVEANDLRQQVLGIFFVAAFIITGVSFLMWIYRANVNCHGFGTQDMHYTPGWSIGWYFIPLANLIEPYKAMREIWKVSSNPVEWQTVKTGWLLRAWWSIWLLSSFINNFSFRMSWKAKTITDLKDATAMSIASGVLDIPCYLIGISLVSAIASKQDNWVKNNTHVDPTSGNGNEAAH